MATPSGAAFHLPTCLHVDASAQMVNGTVPVVVTRGEIVRRNLRPCGTCNPPRVQVLSVVKDEAGR